MFGRRAVQVFVVSMVMAMTVAVAGCAGGASATFPAPPPGGLVTMPAEAVARVIANEPRLTGIQPFDSGLIGQSSWYTVEPASGVGAFIVTIRVGWGDCEAGCIEEHTWTVAVAPDGALTILSETGQPVPADAWPSPLGAGQTGIVGVALAGPVCPVETVPPDPNCAPRPVVGATIVIHDLAGSEVAQTVTEADGSFFVAVPAGEYTVEPRAVDGLIGTAAAVQVTVKDGIAAQVQLEYDTGIR
jgi:hypothetical protein